MPNFFCCYVSRSSSTAHRSITIQPKPNNPKETLGNRVHLKNKQTSLAIHFSPRQIALTKMTNETTKMIIEARRKKMIIRLSTIWAQNPAIMFTAKRQSAANTYFCQFVKIKAKQCGLECVYISYMYTYINAFLNQFLKFHGSNQMNKKS